MTTELITHTQAERQRLAGLLDHLTPQQWHHPSLCAGWRVCEVVAHMTMPFRTKPWRLLTGLLSAGFRFNKFADRDARATAAAMDQRELVQMLKDNITHPWRPPGGGAAGALSHDVIHGLDITEPLGLPAPPTERIAMVLASGDDRQLRYFGVDLGGHTLVATDADIRVGKGANQIEVSAKDLLLVVTGRLPLERVAG
ncbi:maleylpyruvate isomerase family mycothiol-dependent enzyme [Thermocrispum municipale]|jgi:uncharacterized protein (TIGR03083 family)|nr:maleylpyruvate isomerase family mycothiol-dependent enzyme [Thermocrispum municipale]